MRKLLLVLISLQIAHFCKGQLNSKQLNYPLISQTGDSVTLGQLIKGKVAFINFWFIPCGPCFAEMPMLQRIYMQNKSDSNFIFLSISKSSPEAIKQFLKKNDSDTTLYRYFRNNVPLDTITYPIFSVLKCQDNILGIVKNPIGEGYLLKIKSIPTDIEYNPPIIFDFKAFPSSILVDKNGNVVYKKTGFNKKNENAIESEIKIAIKKALK